MWNLVAWSTRAEAYVTTQAYFEHPDRPRKYLSVWVYRPRAHPAMFVVKLDATSDNRPFSPSDGLSSLTHHGCIKPLIHENRPPNLLGGSQ